MLKHLFHIETKVDVSELAKVIDNARRDAAYQCLMLLQRRSYRLTRM